MGEIAVRAIRLLLFFLALQGTTTARSVCSPLPQAKIGLQLFTVLSLVAAPSPPIDPSAPFPPGVFPHFAARGADFESTLRALHQLGFDYFERFSGTLDLVPKEYLSLAKQAHMQPVASHDKLSTQTWDAVLAQAKSFGQPYVGASTAGEPGIDSLEHTLATAERLNGFGRAAVRAGLKFYVHHQAKDFSTRYVDPQANLDDGALTRPAWEIIAAHTDPRYVHFELDIHWVRVGLGLDRFDELLALLRKYQNRVELLHLKDTAADGSIADLGEGTTNWPLVYSAAGGGVRFYIWEYDMPPHPLSSAAIAYEFMRCRKDS